MHVMKLSEKQRMEVKQLHKQLFFCVCEYCHDERLLFAHLWCKITFEIYIAVHNQQQWQLDTNFFISPFRIPFSHVRVCVCESVHNLCIHIFLCYLLMLARSCTISLGKFLLRRAARAIAFFRAHERQRNFISPLKLTRWQGFFSLA